jgi:hypothetical protein
VNSPFKTEYLGVWPEPSKSFEPRCRNCKKQPHAHVNDTCLFEATVWAPMTVEELDLWREERRDAGIYDDDYVPIDPKE